MKKAHVGKPIRMIVRQNIHLICVFFLGFFHLISVSIEKTIAPKNILFVEEICFQFFSVRYFLSMFLQVLPSWFMTRAQPFHRFVGIWGPFFQTWVIWVSLLTHVPVNRAVIEIWIHYKYLTLEPGSKNPVI